MSFLVCFVPQPSNLLYPILFMFFKTIYCYLAENAVGKLQLVLSQINLWDCLIYGTINFKTKVSRLLKTVFHYLLKTVPEIQNGYVKW